MNKNKNPKTPTAKKKESKKSGRREFLERSGLTAGGILMTTLAASGISEGQTTVVSTTTQQRALTPDAFRQLFDAALTDKTFQNDILTQGFKALDARGYNFAVPTTERTLLEDALVIDVQRPKPRCGVCGVCGLCGLCGELNLGSASAALWALFHLA